MPISPPVKITTPFANSGDKATIPATADNVNGRAGYNVGFPPITFTPKVAGGIPPWGADFNGIFFEITQALQYLEAGGSFPFDGTWAAAVGGYPVGALVSRSDNSGLWRNTVANNTTNPESGGTGWQPEDAGATSITMTNANVTLTALQAARSIIIITGTLTANLQLIFPTYVKQWQVINNTTGNFSITCKTASGNGVVISRVASIVGDGTNIASANSNISIPGVIGESRNASMSIASASATGSFSAESLIVGESLSGQVYRLTGISPSINLATTGAGGMDTGLAPASGYVALYVIYNPTTNTVAMLARDATAARQAEVYGGANMPAGFTASALVAVVRTNASRQFTPFVMFGRSVSFAANAIFTNSAAQAPSPTALGLSAVVPPNAVSCSGILNIGSTAAGLISMYVGVIAASFAGQQGIAATGTQTSPGITGSFVDLPIPLTAPAQIAYTASTSAGTMSATLSITGYKF